MKSSSNQIIKVGARGSKLSLAQTNWVIDQLKHAHPDRHFDLVIIRTSGDKDQSSSLTSIGGTGIFVKELETALLHREIDVAVHSAKDLPSRLESEFRIAAVPERAPVADVLVSSRGESLTELPQNARIATGSPRRRALARNLHRSLEFVEVRGNVDTRLRKLDEGHFDAIILARAGLCRLGLEDRITQILPPEEFIPAAGQGALALEVRTDDANSAGIVSKISSPEDSAAVRAERSLMYTLNAGCDLPVGAWACWTGDRTLTLYSVVSDVEGKNLFRVTDSVHSAGAAETLGARVAEKLFDLGLKYF